MHWEDVAALYRHPREAEAVYFREVTGQLPPFYGPGRWFYVELHLLSGEYDWWGPLAIATVHEPDNGRPNCLSLMVLDAARSNGFRLLRMVETIGERWPSIYWTRAFKSWSFHQALVRLGIVQYDDGIYSFIPKQQRQGKRWHSSEVTGTP